MSGRLKTICTGLFTAGAAMIFAGVAMGAHVYRWEPPVWIASSVVTGFCLGRVSSR